jgi:hypothetical protein
MHTVGLAPLTEIHRWVRDPWAQLLFIQHCMTQIPPSLAMLERVMRFHDARGSMDEHELKESLDNLKTPAGQAAFTLLNPTETAQAFKDMGVTQDAASFTAATYSLPGRHVFYAVKQPNACLLEIKVDSATLGPFLNYGGWSEKYFFAASLRQHDVIFPRLVKELNSVNLRTLRAAWQDDQFSGRFVMRGNWGVDSEQLSRLDVEQQNGRIRILMGPAFNEDLLLLGIDSAQIPWPVSESLQTEITGFIANALNWERRLDYSNLKRHWERAEPYPFEMKPTLWPYAYLTDAAKKQMPKTMYAPSPTSPSGLDKDMTIIFAGIPKNYQMPTSVEPLLRAFFCSVEPNRQSPRLESRNKGHKSITLMPPKVGEGIAKGLATYRIIAQPKGVHTTYEMVVKTKGALPDDKLLSFAQIRLMTAEELRSSQPMKSKTK